MKTRPQLIQALLRLMRTRLLAITSLLILTACHIPVVGNSSQEIKHRKEIQRDSSQQKDYGAAPLVGWEEIAPTEPQ